MNEETKQRDCIIDDSNRRGTMLVPLSAVHRCIVSRDMVSGTMARIDVPLQIHNLKLARLLI